MPRIRAIFTSVFFFSVFTNLLMLTSPLFMLQVYDRVLTSGSKPTLLTLFLLVVVLYVLLGVLEFARSRLLARASAYFKQVAGRRIFEASIKARATRAPELFKQATIRDVDQVQKLLGSPTMIAVFDLPWAPLFFGALFVFHPWMGWFGIASGLILIALTLTNELVSRRQLTGHQNAGMMASQFATGATQSADLICSQGMLGHVSERWQTFENASLAKDISYTDTLGVFSSTSTSLRMLFQSGMLALGALLVVNNELSAGAIIAGTVLLGRALGPVEKMLSGWRALKLGIPSWKKVQTAFKVDGANKDVILERPDAHLHVDNISVMTTTSREPILRNISFEIKPGEVIGLFGHSASGKTTLLKTLLGLQKIAMGDIRLGGARLDQYAPDHLGKYIGFMPQTIDFLPGSVADNIARFNPHRKDQEVFQAARMAGVHDMILALPKGYETQLSETSAVLSGGQKQRMALARALHGAPEILVLDEPSAALDEEGKRALLEAMRQHKQAAKSVLVATHDASLMFHVDHFLELEGGTVVRRGSRRDMLKSMTLNGAQIPVAQNEKRDLI